MNIIDALKSGKRFRRTSWQGNRWFTADDIVPWAKTDILADDWEVEEKQITITESMLKSAWVKACQCSGYHDDDRPLWLYTELKKELGL